MKVKFNRQALAEALGLVASVVPSRTPKPVLHCIRITAQDQDVHICATNLEVGLNHLIAEVKIDEPGQAVLDAAKLVAIVRETIDDVITFEVDDNTCEIKGSDSHFTIYGQDPEQFPAVPTFDGQVDIELGLNALQTGIKQCLFATAKESSRYAINGVLWEIKGKKLTLVATDGRRLARTRVSLSAAPSDEISQQKIIVPAKTMALLERISAHEKDRVAIKLVGTQILFQCAQVVISSNLVEGAFPKYEDIIPKDYDKRLTLSTEVVSSAVRRASLLASEESKGIKLCISENSLVFSGRAPEAGAAEIRMAIDYTGEPINIGFNPQFLSDALRIVTAENFDLELGQADRPGMIKSGSDFLYVIMPINLA
ncbi:DNA polymerase III subunit beta [Planctomycetota bacterium]